MRRSLYSAGRRIGADFKRKEVTTNVVTSLRLPPYTAASSFAEFSVWRRLSFATKRRSFACSSFQYTVRTGGHIVISTLPTEYLPDFVLYMGDSLVCRSINNRLASVDNLELWRVNADGDFSCPFRHVDKVLACKANELLDQLADKLAQRKTTPASDYLTWWDNAFNEEKQRIEEGVDEYSLTAESTVAYFESQLEDMYYSYETHYANSTAIRLACRHARGHRVCCNRGVNGIDGCVSTAVGHAAATDAMVFCITGDLSFFYDQNALWNQNLGSNLRIIILNDHRGGIFSNVSGLENCDSRYVAGVHNTDARGITTQNDVGYLSAKTVDEMHLGIVRLMTEETTRPMVLEVEEN